MIAGFAKQSCDKRYDLGRGVIYYSFRSGVTGAGALLRAFAVVYAHGSCHRRGKRSRGSTPCAVVPRSDRRSSAGAGFAARWSPRCALSC